MPAICLNLENTRSPCIKRSVFYPAKSDIAKLYITGKFAESVAAGAREEDDSLDIFTGTKEEILENLTDWLMPGDWVLIKGSRAMGMEKIVEGLKSHAKINATIQPQIHTDERR